MPEPVIEWIPGMWALTGKLLRLSLQSGDYKKNSAWDRTGPRGSPLAWREKPHSLTRDKPVSSDTVPEQVTNQLPRLSSYAWRPQHIPCPQSPALCSQMPC